MPISRVRSLTVTNSTFIMPMPPTTKTMLAMDTSSRVIVLVEAVAASILLPASLMVKLAPG